jgi:hypothetical protein
MLPIVKAVKLIEQALKLRRHGLAAGSDAGSRLWASNVVGLRCRGEITIRRLIVNLGRSGRVRHWLQSL